MQLAALQGVGAKRLAALEAAGIFSISDLQSYLPRSYLDFSSPKPLATLQDGEDACVRVQVSSMVQDQMRFGRHMMRIGVEDVSGRAVILWFNQPFLKPKLTFGRTLRLIGRIQKRMGEIQMICPRIADSEDVGILPIYPAIEDIPQKILRDWVSQSLRLEPIEEILPQRVLHEWRLMGRREALQTLHHPQSMGDLSSARKRMAFEELLVFQVALRQLRGNLHTRVAQPIIAPIELQETFWKGLPFVPTQAQRRVLQEIVGDLARSRPMARLVQGDVGSGKTAVAAGAILTAVKAGKQCAMMAPTEILASQHLVSFQNMLSSHGVRVALLTSSVAKAERVNILSQLQTGELDLLIGTHALIQPDVVFRDLGLVVTDEQHRFGVRQRQALADKGESPHVLVMSATPIPRTLALILYGDLDISVLDEMPPGRTPVQTHQVPEEKRADMYNFVRQQVRLGRQAFVVCPLVEESQKLEARAAQELLEELKLGFLGGLRIGLLHGRLRPVEKDAVMQAFAAGNLDVLVSTTVVEVGVNVPNASVMVIENAERFGLAQLHQLRGRVGRGAHESYCFLLGGAGESLKRLKFLSKNHDGFAIAEMDLAQRGPGEFLGNRQSGLADGKLAGLAQDVRLLSDARSAMDMLLTDPWQAEYAALQLQAMRRYEKRLAEIALH